MLVLIDESGDAGFKMARGSTPVFVVGMAIFNDFAEAERASAAIATARVALKVKPEFKFNKCSNDARDGFFRAVEPFNFRVRALVVRKELVYSENLRDSKELFYNFFVKLLLKHDDDMLSGARVKIDGSGDREFKRELATHHSHGGTANSSPGTHPFLRSLARTPCCRSRVVSQFDL